MRRRSMRAVARDWKGVQWQSVEVPASGFGTEHFTSRKGQSGAFCHSSSFHALDLSNIQRTCKNTC